MNRRKSIAEPANGEAVASTRPVRGRTRAPRPEGLPGQLGAAVERLREARHWSSADLARAAGLGLGTVIRVEAGRVSPTLETVLALAHALHMSGRDLLAACPDWMIQPEQGE